MNSLVPCRCGHTFDGHDVRIGAAGQSPPSGACLDPDCACVDFEAQEEEGQMAHETVETIGRWADETFGPGDPASPRRALRLLEEVAELCLAYGASANDIVDEVWAAAQKHLRKTVPDYEALTLGEVYSLWDARRPEPEKVPGELADGNIVLATVAHQLKVDLAAETDAKMKINRARTWDVAGDGTGQHT